MMSKKKKRKFFFFFFEFSLERTRNGLIRKRAWSAKRTIFKQSMACDWRVVFRKKNGPSVLFQEWVPRECERFFNILINILIVFCPLILFW